MLFSHFNDARVHFCVAVVLHAESFQKILEEFQSELGVHVGLHYGGQPGRQTHGSPGQHGHSVELIVLAILQKTNANDRFIE